MGFLTKTNKIMSIKIKEFNKENLKTLRLGINKSLQDLGERYGIDIKTRSPKYPIIAKDSDGIQYKFSEEQFSRYYKEV